MNKTIIINISGIIFHIEEDAYELLRKYMNDVKRYFSNSSDSFEIVTDIENRVAEMFSDLLKKENKQVIVSSDVESVIAQMGNTSDFETESTAEHTFTQEQVRFEETKKRLYRNPDDKIVGGVCSGIAAYFDADPLWIRLALVLSVVFFGSGILLYIILWIIMPEAKTRSEKLSMRGEKINIDTIKKSVEEELGNVKRNFTAAGDEISGMRYSPAVPMLRNFIQNMIDLLGRTFGVLFTVIGKLIGIFLMFVGGVFAFATLMVLFAALGMIHSNLGPGPDFPFHLIVESGSSVTYISWFLVIVIPSVVVALLGFRMVFNINAFNRISGLSLVGVWVLALIVGGYKLADIAGQFREEGTLKETKILSASGNKSNTYYLKLSDLSDRFYEDSNITSQLNMDGKVVVKRHRGDGFYNNVSISIERSENKEMRLVTIYNSKGKDVSSAIKTASGISYNFSQKDSILTFDNHFEIKDGMFWRAPWIKLILYVPEQTNLVIDDELDHYIHNINSSPCNRNNLEQVQWKMTNYGLICDKEIESVDTL